jgi:hypothetical protein
MNERVYQSRLIKKLHSLFPDCVVIKNDPAYMQGIPDLIVLYNDKWAMLEVKASERSRIQPNQRHYIDEFNWMSFAAFIYPENEEEILHELQRAFQSCRTARVS